MPWNPNMNDWNFTGSASPLWVAPIRQPQQVQFIAKCNRVIETLRCLLLCRLHMHTAEETLGLCTVWSVKKYLWDCAHLWLRRRYPRIALKTKASTAPVVMISRMNESYLSWIRYAAKHTVQLKQKLHKLQEKCSSWSCCSMQSRVLWQHVALPHRRDVATHQWQLLVQGQISRLTTNATHCHRHSSQALWWEPAVKYGF